MLPEEGLNRRLSLNACSHERWVGQCWSCWFVLVCVCGLLGAGVLLGVGGILQAFVVGLSSWWCEVDFGVSFA